MDSVIVLDPGSQTLKAGYAYAFPSAEEPRIITPCAVIDSGVHQNQQSQHLPLHKYLQASLAERHPVQDGQIVDFDGLETLIHHSLYQKLGWPIGDEGAVVLCEPLLTCKTHREQLAQLMFEVFNVNGLFLQDQSTLALYALGKLTGCVVDVGHSKTDVSTVTEGQVNVPSIRRLPLGGSQLSHLLRSLLAAKGVDLPHSSSSGLMEACAAAAETQQQFEQLNASPCQPTQYTLPDGSEIQVEQEGYMVGESLFQPSLLARAELPGEQSGLTQPSQAVPGLAQVVAECVGSAFDLVNKRAGHIKEVCVVGGGSLIPGLGGRLLKEIKGLCPVQPSPGVCVWPDYLQTPDASKYGAWIGGAVLGKVLGQQNQCFVSRAEYDDIGPGAIHRKCA